MEESRMYTQKEMEELAVALKERQETLEALECARIVMTETRQYPRFITRIDHLIRSIEGAPAPETKEEVKEPIKEPIKPTLIEPKQKVK
jgi:hypothetical protein